ncbi:MAG: regulatory protein GemA [Roseibium sp.]|uniref:regulatory protein GemA n=1 Tax=Roseibium sp. TaxID=1936156 RepID=UPI00326775C3
MSAIARIHIRKKQLGLDDDTYRAMLERVTGKTSSANMDSTEHRKVLAEMNRLSGATTASGRYAPVLQALWKAGYNLGVIDDRSDKAMTAFVQRQTGLDHTRFLHHGEDAASAIEGLKGWIRGATGNSDLFRKRSGRPALLNNPRFQVALTQWPQLDSLDALPAASLIDFVGNATGQQELATLTKADWVLVMNRLGRLLRQAREKIAARTEEA